MVDSALCPNAAAKITHCGVGADVICKGRSRRISALRLIAIIIAKLLLVLLPAFAAGFIAHITAFNAHPDEAIHIDAFEYYRTHWLRPEPGSPLVAYSAYGWSRVYTGEVVYFLYGKIGSAVLHFWPQLLPFHVYRFCNVALLLITLTVLAMSQCQLFKPWLLALVIIAVPQAIYVYGYANSDAFGISADVLLLLQTARMIERPPSQWEIWSIGYFWLLCLMTILSKTPFMLGLILPAALLLVFFFRQHPAKKFLLTRFVAPLLAIYIVAAIWSPVLSPWHSHWRQQMTAMRQDKAVPGRKPHDPAPAWGVNLIEYHWTYTQMLAANNHDWWRTTGQSFFGEFGYMTVVLPTWMYTTAGYSPLGLFALTLITTIIYRKRMTWALWICMACAPLLIAANLAGSMYHSLHFDYQPQGRYLFASLPAIYFLCLGTWPIERIWWRSIRLLSLLFFFGLSLFILIDYVGTAPALR